jgi:methyl-accepting chemotaxis protein
MDVLGVERRKLGTGMLVFGIIGVLLAAVVAAGLIGGAIAARNLDDRLSADQERIAASLTRLTASMDSLAMTTDHAGATLRAASDALDGAQGVLGGVADTSVAVSGALGAFSILGNQPLAGASDKLQALARSVTDFQAKADTLATSLATNADDAASMTAQIRLLKDEANQLATQVAAFDRIGEIVGLLIGAAVICGLLTAWIALGAALCAWAGWRLRRPPA